MIYPQCIYPSISAEDVMNKCKEPVGGCLSNTPV